MTETVLRPPNLRLPMSKRKQPAAPVSAPRKQINFRPTEGMEDRLTAVANALGLDVSNLVRLIISQNLAKYEIMAAEAAPAVKKPG